MVKNLIDRQAVNDIIYHEIGDLDKVRKVRAKIDALPTISKETILDLIQYYTNFDSELYKEVQKLFSVQSKFIEREVEDDTPYDNGLVICKNCGNEINFCPICGAEIVGDTK